MQGIKIQLLRRPTDEPDELEAVQPTKSNAESKQAEEATLIWKKGRVESHATTEQERRDRTGEGKADDVYQPRGEENGSQKKRRGRKSD